MRGSNVPDLEIGSMIDIHNTHLTKVSFSKYDPKLAFEHITDSQIETS